MAVVVIDERCEHDLELASVEDQHPVEALSADSPHETLGKCVGPWSSDRRSDGTYPFGPEDLIEVGCEFGISVTH